jgi:hypothetical protein
MLLSHHHIYEELYHNPKQHIAFLGLIAAEVFLDQHGGIKQHW